MNHHLRSLEDKTALEALAIVKQASNTARAWFRSTLDVQFKSDESPVTKADQTIELEIRTALNKAFPDHGVLGEEHGVEGEHKTDMWIIDPIDGTKSFITGHPLFGMLLGLTQNGIPKLGIVGMPAIDETYVGGPGLGAQMNGTEISVSDKTKLVDATLYINEADKILADNGALFTNIVTCARTVRLSNDCYPHALLALGHVDIVLDYDLKPYDFLPVVALIQGAGGIITDWDGKVLTPTSDGRILAASTPELHEQMLGLLRGAAK